MLVRNLLFEGCCKGCNVSDEKKEELMKSGAPRFHNQVCWARQYLLWEGLLGPSKLRCNGFLDHFVYVLLVSN
ncbi:MAG: winged helix-turn-helix domain-containing protein, partial [Verrucomicrobiota bacterium]